MNYEHHKRIETNPCGNPANSILAHKQITEQTDFKTALALWEQIEIDLQRGCEVYPFLLNDEVQHG